MLLEAGKLDIADVISWPLEHVAPLNCEILIKRESVCVGGRYIKLSRSLAQTPWLVDGVRKLLGSVEECIVEPMRTVVNFSAAKFSSSGREDCDVRMLGDGRPFVLDIKNLESVRQFEASLEVVERVINESGRGKLQVRSYSYCVEVHIMCNRRDVRSNNDPPQGRGCTHAFSLYSLAKPHYFDYFVVMIILSND